MFQNKDENEEIHLDKLMNIKITLDVLKTEELEKKEGYDFEWCQGHILKSSKL